MATRAAGHDGGDVTCRVSLVGRAIEATGHTTRPHAIWRLGEVGDSRRGSSRPDVGAGSARV